MKDNAFAEHVRDDYDAHVYYFDYKLDSTKVNAILELFKGRYDVVIIGLHGAGSSQPEILASVHLQST
jgi:hypothetical protein